MSNHAPTGLGSITESDRQARPISKLQVTTLGAITLAITLALAGPLITATTQQSRPTDFRWSGNHATNHANHAAGNHARSPLCKRGRVSQSHIRRTLPARHP